MNYKRTLFLSSFFLLLSQIIAFGKTYPWSLLPGGTGRILWDVLSTVFLLFVLKEALFPEWNWASWDELIARVEIGILSLLQSRLSWLVLIALNIVFQTLSFIKFRSLGYQFPFFPFLLCLSCLPFFARGRLKMAFLLNLALLVGSIFYFPLSGFRSDMLPVIQEALNFWSAGKTPYFNPTQHPWGISGMPYFPGILFSHLAAWVVGLDLRWNQFFYRAAWMAILYRRIQTAPDPRGGLIFVFFALSPFINFRHDLYFESFLLLLALWLVVKKARFFLIPLIAFWWQFGLIIAPFLAWEEIFYKKEPVRGWIGRAVWLVAGTLAVGVSFYLALAGTTKMNSLIISNLLMMRGFQPEETVYGGDYGLNFGSLMIGMGFGNLTYLFMGSIALVVFIYFVSRRPGRPGVFWNCTWAVLALVFLCSVHFWQYFWIFPVFWMSLGLLEKEESQSP